MGILIKYSYKTEQQDMLSHVFGSLLERHDQLVSLVRVSGNLFQNTDFQTLVEEISPYAKYFETLVLESNGVRLVLKGVYPEPFSLKLKDNPKDTLDALCEVLESLHLLGFQEEVIQNLIQKRMGERSGF